MDSVNGRTPQKLENRSEFEVTANATNDVVEGFAFPKMTDWLFYYIRVIVANILIIYITGKVTRKCLELKMLRSAHHAFYCIIAGLMCMSETLLFYYHIVLHPFFGLVTLGLGWMGIGVQIINQWNQHEMRYISKHAIFGFTGSVMLFILAGSGIVILSSPLSPATFSFMLSGHRFFGLVSYVVVMTAISFSYNTGFARRNWSPDHIDWLKRCTFIVAVTTCSHEISRLVVFIVNNVPKVFYEKLHIFKHEHRE